MYGTTQRQENCWFGGGIRLEGLTLGHRLETIQDLILGWTLKTNNIFN